MGYWGLKNIETFLPIDWAEDGTTAPEAAALVTSGSGNFRARNFASDQSEDIAISWKVPVGIDTAAPITIRVNMIVTNATGPSNEGIVFDLSGYCTGDNDSINGTPGDSVNATSTALTAAQYDLQDT